jgi:hypothetical protein
LISYSDSDYAGDIDNSHNTFGVLLFLGSSLVSWHSLKQHVVAMSSRRLSILLRPLQQHKGFGWLGFSLI